MRITDNFKSVMESVNTENTKVIISFEELMQEKIRVHIAEFGEIWGEEETPRYSLACAVCEHIHKHCRKACLLSVELFPGIFLRHPCKDSQLLYKDVLK